MLTFGVNHKDLVVGENDAAREYPIPEMGIYSMNETMYLLATTFNNQILMVDTKRQQSNSIQINN